MSAKLDDMALFATVVQEGSFTAAGRSLGITKQSVSERVAKLEHELGVTLLARSTRTMRLTEPGERFHRACAEIVTLAADAMQDINRGQSEPSGLLRVTAPEVLGHELVLPVMAELRRRHPGLTYELALSDQRVDLIDGAFDVAVRLGDPPKGLSSRRLGNAMQRYVASPELLAAHEEIRSLSGLRDLPCIGRSPVERWSLGRASLRVEPKLVVSTHEGLRRAACLGLGVARIAEALTADDLRDGRLRVLFGACPALQGPVNAVWRTGAYPPRRLELFLEVLSAHAERWAPLSGSG